MTKKHDSNDGFVKNEIETNIERGSNIPTANVQMM
jgi:hypothetical protein